MFSTRLLSLLLLGTGCALGQTAQITGRVSDATSAVVVGARIEVVEIDTGIERTTLSNEQGSYSLPLLKPGNYRLTVQAPGFRTLNRSGIRLDVAEVARLDFVLEVGEVTQNIEVNAAAPLLESSSSSLGTLVEGKQIVNLPLLGRNPYALVTLVPGARAPISFNDTPVNMFTNQFVSVNGARGYQNEYLLDGAPNTNPGQAGPTLFPSADSIEEFKVLTNSYSAEYGRAAGGVFNAVTKSGTNRFHGGAWDFLRHDNLTAGEFFANRAGRDKPHFRFHQFGAIFGGPLIRNRTFFFGDYEGVRQRQGATATGTMPTQLQRQGDFSESRNTAGQVVPVFDPLTTQPDPSRPGQSLRVQFPGNRIPANRFDAVARNLSQLYPLPNAPGNPVTGVGNWAAAGVNRTNKDIFGVRVDHKLSDRQYLYGRVSYDKTPVLPPNNYGNIAGPTHTGQVFARRGVVLDDNIIFGPTLIANLKYGFNRLINDRTPISFGSDMTQFGFPESFARAVPLPMMPVIAVQGFNNLSFTGFIHFGLDTHSWQGSVIKTRGNHTIKSGAEVRLIRNNEIQLGDAANTFSFNPNFTQGPNPTVAGAGHAFASFLLGTGTGQWQIIPAVAFQNLFYGAYVQDDIRVTPKLTLNLGVRWDYETPRTDRFDQLANFDFGATSPLSSTTGLDLRGGLAFVNAGGLPRGQWNPDRNNIAPRFGFAWTAMPKLVVRGGFGLFFAPQFAGTGSGPTPFGLSGFSAQTTFVGSLDGVTPASFMGNPYPQGLLQPTGSSQGLHTLLGENVAFVDRALRTPYTQQWNLNIQRELPQEILLEVAYVGSHGLKIFNSRQFNQLPDSALALGDGLRQQVPNPFFGQIASGALAARTISRGQLLRPYPHFQNVTSANSSWGNSIYHSFQASLERRFSRGVSVMASYTFSKLIDDVTGAFAGETLSGTAYQSWNNLRAERAVSAFDTPQRLVIGGVWEIPAGNLPALFFKGWQVNGIATFASGNIIGVTSASNTTFSFGGGQRPNWNGQNPLAANPTIDRWLDPSAFSAAPPYTFGNAPRNFAAARASGTSNLDFSVIKNTRFGERFNAQFRAEFFNFSNTPRFDPPNANFGTPNFGVVTAQANRPRVLQLGLKLLF